MTFSCHLKALYPLSSTTILATAGNCTHHPWSSIDKKKMGYREQFTHSLSLSLSVFQLSVTAGWIGPDYTEFWLCFGWLLHWFTAN